MGENENSADANPRKQKKLIIFGPPKVGKTSIILSVFGSVEPEIILQSPIEPTMGIETEVYRWGHVEIGVFDLSGQEMEIFLTQERDFIFPSTDVLLLVFAYGTDPQKLMGLLKQMGSIIRRYEISETFILIHKIDQAKNEEEQKKYLQTIQDGINNLFGIESIRVFGTSLYPKYFGKFKFQVDWILSGLEISLKSMKELKAVPVSEDLL
ncbi:MAG: ADP-ribosylation factor-like protein, partial [Promethearchaeota archaeon]